MYQSQLFYFEKDRNGKPINGDKTTYQLKKLRIYTGN